MKSLYEEILLDLLVVSVTGALLVSPSWQVCVALVAAMSLKGISIYAGKSKKRDDVTKAEEAIKKLQSDVKNIHMKLGLERR